MRRRRRKGGGKQYEVTIERLGGRGDGLAASEDSFGRAVNLFAPLTAPGDKVLLREVSPFGDGIITEIVELIEASPLRCEPPCPHFGTCGGCQLQQLDTATYRHWKQDRAVEAASRITGGDASSVAPMIEIDPASRRRARIIARLSAKKGAVIGFRGRASHSLAAFDSCLLLEPSFEADLRSALTKLSGELTDAVELECQATSTPQGLDLVFRDTDEPTLDFRLAVGALAQHEAVARVTWMQGNLSPETLMEKTAPRVTLGEQEVPLPPGAFLQPSLPGEQALSDLVQSAVAGSRNIVDLFAGIGTLCLPLVGNGRKLRAYDSFAPSMASLTRTGVGITSEARDLAKQPLLAAEFTGVDAVILDPPRAGAKEQIRQLMLSGVPKIVYVSCNPTTFARDGAWLFQAGYDLKRLTPVDQFTWSAQLEVVGVFEKKGL